VPVDSEASEIDVLDRRIVDQHRVAAVFRERIAGLESRLAIEQAEQRAKQYLVEIDKFGKQLAGLPAEAREVVTTVTGACTAIERFRSALAAAINAIPEGVTVYRSELGGDRLERVLAAAFAPFAPEWENESGMHWDLRRKLQNVRDELAEFPAGERAGYDQLIERLRVQPAPQPEPESEPA
jgi:hypothetical protein